MKYKELIEANGLNLHGDIELFANLVAAQEREECAKECERMMMYPNAKQESAAHQDVWAAAKAIRARGTT